MDWYNHYRLHSTCGDVPLAEYEDAYYRQNAGLTEDPGHTRASTEAGAID